MHANIAYLEEPQTYVSAMSGRKAEYWQKAMEEEMESIKKNNTWSLTSLPSGREAIGCKWVYRLKYNQNGSINKFKARIVAKGYSQIEGIDYNETFAPVTSLATLRVMIALAASRDLEIHQMDVKSAYLNGDLKEEIYMKQPEGFVEEDKEDLVC